MDLETFDPARLDAAWQADFRKQWGLEGKFVALVVGRVSRLKGVDVLIRAVAELKEAWPELVALVVGGPQKHQEDYLDELKALARDLGVQDRVVFTGSQTHIPEIDALADVLCSCNVSKPESFGRTVAEALAMETPVIAAAHGGVLDIVRDGQDGFLVPPAMPTPWPRPSNASAAPPSPPSAPTSPTPSPPKRWPNPPSPSTNP